MPGAIPGDTYELYCQTKWRYVAVICRPGNSVSGQVYCCNIYIWHSDQLILPLPTQGKRQLRLVSNLTLRPLSLNSTGFCLRGLVDLRIGYQQMFGKTEENSDKEGNPSPHTLLPGSLPRAMSV